MTMVGTRPEADRRILVVDDEAPIRRVLERILVSAGYRCDTAADVREARRALHDRSYDLVLSDVMMPEENGFSLLAHVRDQYPETAVIMVTAVDDPAAATPAANYGAYGYLIKPFEPNAIIINVAAALRRRDDSLAERMHCADLEQAAARDAIELEQALLRLDVTSAAWTASQEETVDRLAQAAEWRDRTTGEHLLRVSGYVVRLAQAVRMPEDKAEQLRIASKLHDVGKIALPDAVLLKNGRYTDEERAVMQTHSEVGARMLQESDSALLRLAGQVAWSHHEHFDGSGYPRGLKGLAIPLEGRIVAVADVYDALRSERPYKLAYPHERAHEIMTEMRGRELDPDLVDLFLDDVGRDIA